MEEERKEERVKARRKTEKRKELEEKGQKERRERKETIFKRILNDSRQIVAFACIQ